MGLFTHFHEISSAFMHNQSLHSKSRTVNKCAILFNIVIFVSETPDWWRHSFATITFGKKGVIVWSWFTHFERGRHTGKYVSKILQGAFNFGPLSVEMGPIQLKFRSNAFVFGVKNPSGLRSKSHTLSDRKSSQSSSVGRSCFDVKWQT